MILEKEPCICRCTDINAQNIFQFSGLVDEWEVDGLSCESSSCKSLWALHCALLQQKFARLRHLDTHLTAVESGRRNTEIKTFSSLSK